MAEGDRIEGTEKAEAAQVAQLINTFGSEFWEMVQARHELGEKKYGPGKFLRVDTMEEALFELADLANYACYTFVRIRMLQDALQKMGAPDFAKTLDPNA